MRDCKDCQKWQEVTKCDTPEEMKVWITSLQMDILEIRRTVEEMRAAPKGHLCRCGREFDSEEDSIGCLHD